MNNITLASLWPGNTWNIAYNQVIAEHEIGECPEDCAFCEEAQEPLRIDFSPRKPLQSKPYRVKSEGSKRGVPRKSKKRYFHPNKAQKQPCNGPAKTIKEQLAEQRKAQKSSIKRDFDDSQPRNRIGQWTQKPQQ